ncbi:GNAT family N-acetyltransferase [Alkalicoccus halolimnae]|uniref:GNAT family protein n=1 Tax=Alkalicoccus halolimnae TaxID=1667239 RepID=A0A5C7FHM5_9BACI|nr:GNAT family protein [Alkalicoccus halolimnae]TXF86807.1 GNAT family N-acetyltransferase [Alkalicoccus halolimnae]
MGNFLIRPARPADAEAVREISWITCEEGFGLATPSEFSRTIDMERNAIQKAGSSPAWSRFLTAESEGKIVGFLHFIRRTEDKYRHHGSFGMSILPEYRSHGIGACLLRELIGWAEQQPGLEKITLEVLAGNKSAIHLYEKFMFQEEGRLQNHVYFKKSFDDLLLMALFVSYTNLENPKSPAD